MQKSIEDSGKSTDFIHPLCKDGVDYRKILVLGKLDADLGNLEGFVDLEVKFMEAYDRILTSRDIWMPIVISIGLFISSIGMAISGNFPLGIMALVSIAGWSTMVMAVKLFGSRRNHLLASYLDMNSRLSGAMLMEGTLGAVRQEFMKDQDAKLTDDKLRKLLDEGQEWAVTNKTIFMDQISKRLYREDDDE